MATRPWGNKGRPNTFPSKSAAGSEDVIWRGNSVTTPKWRPYRIHYIGSTIFHLLKATKIDQRVINMKMKLRKWYNNIKIYCKKVYFCTLKAGIFENLEKSHVNYVKIDCSWQHYHRWTLINSLNFSQINLWKKVRKFPVTCANIKKKKEAINIQSRLRGQNLPSPRSR